MHTRLIINSTLGTVVPLSSSVGLISSLVTVDRSERGRGQARRVLSMIVEEAQAEGVTLVVEPSPGRDTTMAGLRGLYGREGFVDAREIPLSVWRRLRRLIGPCYRDAVMVRCPKNS